MDYNAPPNSCTIRKAQQEFGLSLGLSNKYHGAVQPQLKIYHSFMTVQIGKTLIEIVFQSYQAKSCVQTLEAKLLSTNTWG